MRVSRLVENHRVRCNMRAHRPPNDRLPRFDPVELIMLLAGVVVLTFMAVAF
jgi:hypothetical protein